MSQTLYILDPDNNPRPVCWAEYDAWDDSIPKHERCSLGKRLRHDVVGNVSIATIFLATPVGYYGRKPQLWITIVIGPSVWDERRYSSHRAALSGHTASIQTIAKSRAIEFAACDTLPEFQETFQK